MPHLETPKSKSEHTLNVFCNRHKKAIENKSKDFDQAYSRMIQEEALKKGGDFLTEAEKRGEVPKDGTEIARFFVQNIKNATPSGAMCCFLGDKKIAELEKTELSKYLMFGGIAEPLTEEEYYEG